VNFLEQNTKFSADYVILASDHWVANLANKISHFQIPYVVAFGNFSTAEPEAAVKFAFASIRFPVQRRATAIVEGLVQCITSNRELAL
jgi:hypothetical protein